MADPKKKSPKKITDVAHPGKTAPAGNSKSVIVPNRPIMKDPMVVEGTVSEDNDEKFTVKTRESVVAPVTDPEIEKTSEEEADQLKKEDDKKTIAVLAEEAAVKKTESQNKEKDKSAQPKAELERPDTSASDVNPEEKPIATDDDKAKVDPTPAEDSISGDVPTERTVAEVDEEELAAQEKHDLEIQKLIDSKQYVLPINSVERRRSKRVVIFGIVLSVLLLVAWADISLDAGLIRISSLPHTHFFDQKNTDSSQLAAQTVTYKSYTSKISNVSFKYPDTWQMLKGSSETKDSIILSSKSDNETFETGTTSVTFESPYVADPASTGVKISYVKYQKLARKTALPLYVRDLVYQDAKGYIRVASTLTDTTNSEVVGNTLASPVTAFYNKDTTVASSFNVYAIKTTDRKIGFASVEDAKAFIGTPTYQQARSILLSTTLK